VKNKERAEAVRLRKEEGLSLNEISERLAVAKSSVSRWVKDVELTSKQIEKLQRLNPVYNNQCKGSKRIKEIWTAKRAAWQIEGRTLASTSDNPLMLAGCMLYWAEGWRKNNTHSVMFTNSDVEMVRMFVKFLVECFGVNKGDVALKINCYTDVHTAEECENYWLKNLCLPRTSLRKTTCDKRPACTKRKKNGLLEYGTAQIRVYNGEILQKIYGAIQFFGEFDRPEWQ